MDYIKFDNINKMHNIIKIYFSDGIFSKKLCIYLLNIGIKFMCCTFNENYNIIRFIPEYRNNMILPENAQYWCNPYRSFIEL